METYTVGDWKSEAGFECNCGNCDHNDGIHMAICTENGKILPYRPPSNSRLVVLAWDDVKGEYRTPGPADKHLQTYWVRVYQWENA